MNKKPKIDHGMSKSFEYRSWSSAKNRCNNPRNKNFHHYGGRGIKMCQEWQDSFMAFYRHIGPRPPNTTLDRINVNLGYIPGNVRWADVDTQVNNRRQTPEWQALHKKYYDAYLQGKTQKEIAIEFNAQRESVSYAIRRHKKINKIKTPNARTQPKHIIERNKTWYELNKSGISFIEIGEMFDTSGVAVGFAVRAYCKKFGIERPPKVLRGPGFNNKFEWDLSGKTRKKIGPTK